MTSLPSQLIASTLQGTLPQQQAQHARQTTDRRRSEISAAIVEAGQKRQMQIDDTGADSEVNPDGTGAGGQGRAFHDETASGPTESAPAGNDDSITTGPDGRVHLDITA